ncbi:MAG: leucine-rich repeat domain-containing protein, partial [Bifidobacteriaceae bacterium]|nr:leucine-rich repeat domain-containing protein [Bifidobacteriaceae bacterium]
MTIDHDPISCPAQQATSGGAAADSRCDGCRGHSGGCCSRRGRAARVGAALLGAVVAAALAVPLLTAPPAPPAQADATPAAPVPCKNVEADAWGSHSDMCVDSAGIHYWLDNTASDPSSWQAAIVAPSGSMPHPDFDRTGGVATIPAAVQHNGVDWPVTGIRAHAFDTVDDDKMKTLDLSGATNLRSIGDGAFTGAWYNDHGGLTEIKWPASLTGDLSIGDQAFFGNRYLKTLSIPAYVTSIGDQAFNVAGSSVGEALQTLEFEEPRDKPLTVGGGAFRGGAATELTLPAEVVGIDYGAFAGFPNLTRVTFKAKPNGPAVAIGDYAFQDDNDLSEVVIQDAEGAGPMTIGDQTFKQTGLTTVTLPGRVASVGNEAFVGLKTVTNLDIQSPGQPLTIGESAFHNTGLTDVTIPSRVSSIGENAFQHDPSEVSSDGSPKGTPLTSLTIQDEPGAPDLVIGASAFSGTDLATVTLPGRVTEVDQGAFADSAKLKSLTIEPVGRPLTVGISAFQNTNLRFLAIPPRVTALGESAFFDTEALKSLTVEPRQDAIGRGEAQPLTIGPDAFLFSGLRSASLGDGVGRVGIDAFRGSELARLDIAPQTGGLTIGPGAFARTNLSSVRIPDGVTAISASDAVEEAGGSSGAGTRLGAFEQINGLAKVDLTG